ncbi:MAG TPA: type II toxin-antitoxin system RelE/ParE family toxin [Burkholderiales bacterium]|nr:type II toxin-antitoxin system RelE/ParE family toxin [Burkholderiales bacterium]
MIKTFSHKGLELFFTTSSTRGIDANQQARVRRILDRLDAALSATDMNLPGYRFHALKGDRAGTYAVAVSGNWRITFSFEGGDAYRVNLEDYH